MSVSVGAPISAGADPAGQCIPSTCAPTQPRRLCRCQPMTTLTASWRHAVLRSLQADAVVAGVADPDATLDDTYLLTNHSEPAADN